jgi:SAM-dependent methyltransferase
VGIASGATVLDVGCGFGDLFGYLESESIEVDYTGYDINPRLVEAARRRYPDARFEVVDIQVEDFPVFDVIVSSSAFNIALQSQDNYEFVADVLRICHEHARTGVAVDFMSSYAEFQGGAFHYSPERLFAIAKGLTKRVALRHDYPLFEFCLYLYPDFEGWQK